MAGQAQRSNDPARATVTTFGVATVILTGPAAVDVITKYQSEIRNLPKMAWIILSIFSLIAGSIALFVAGG